MEATANDRSSQCGRKSTVTSSEIKASIREKARAACSPSPISPSASPLASFVGQVPNDASEDSLRQLFSTYGLVTEAKILTNLSTGKPKGCAFVVFAEKQGADTAIATLHERYALPGSQRPLILRYSTKQMQIQGQNQQLQSSLDRNDPGPFKLYIGNLSKQTTEDEVRQMFSVYGELIDDVVILHDQVTNLSRGVAFVRFAQRHEAAAAIAALNEQMRDKDAQHLLQVKFARTPAEKKQRMGAGAGAGGAAGGYPVANGGMPMGGYYPASYAHGGGYSHPYNPYATMLGGAAVGSYYTPAHAAPGGMHVAGGVGGAGGQHSGGSHQPHSSRPPVAKGPEGANLFIYGIPESYNDGDLQNLFVNFGTIVNAKVYRDLSTGKSKGFGFVSYESLSSAQQAISAMDGYMVSGKKLTVKPKHGEGGAGGNGSGSGSSGSSNGNGHHQQQRSHQHHQGNGHVQHHNHHHQQQQQQHHNPQLQYANTLQQQYQTYQQQLQTLSYQQRQQLQYQNGSPIAPFSSTSSSSPTNAAPNGQQQH
jgi:CUG-BP- and ETR3-like factor